MTTGRVEIVNGKRLLCGVILPVARIQVGQTWAAASGSNLTVEVTQVKDGWVEYCWSERGETRHHFKDSFSFQCRYCLVLPDNQTPP
jgi:hypothetical protein